VTRIVFDGPEDERLAELLEGYLFAVGEVCHGLFGPTGEEAMYRAIGSYFVDYLTVKLKLRFDDTDPWKRYCRIIEAFTSYGFYSHVEMGELEGDAGGYWMLESGQYAGAVWEEAGSWERGSAPCPLWTVILHSLGEIGHTIVLDKVEFRSEENGFYSECHFEERQKAGKAPLAAARRVLQGVILPMCTECKRIRDEAGRWRPVADYMRGHFGAESAPNVCPDCAKKLYPEVFGDGERPAAPPAG